MVKVKKQSHIGADGTIDVDIWLKELPGKTSFDDINIIRNACMLSQLAGNDYATESGESCFQQGMAMADILLDLKVDNETLAAAIVYESVTYAELSIDDVAEQLGEDVAKLVNGVDRMNAINNMRDLNLTHDNRHQLENIRKMLLAMVDDVRVVLIKLAERLRVLRTVSKLPDTIRERVGKEAMAIYAPLANRLGIGAIKWEMEDLSFRYLQPEKYKEIAKGLNSKRLERDDFVNGIVEQFNKKLEELHIINFSVYGRSKHIHSIFRKMIRKKVPLTEIYDATAVRVLVDNEEDCYKVLGFTHDLWEQIPIEFDDYINNPKPNGYRSLHTAVVGPNQRVFEVQIRTHQMHAEAELGVAAHWKYKEGGGFQKASYERKIDWLREVLAWHQELAETEGVTSEVETHFLEDRVYIFTPNGDVLDLPCESTPLDFAYHVHSEVGHRCRGAKVNGNIVQLTYQLQTGDVVEILTGKESKPSRDWINPHLSYLKSSRAKAKVLHWFKSQDYDKNRHDGQVMLDKEIKALGLSGEKLPEIAEKFNFKRVDDMIAALGRGDLRVGQIVSKIQPAVQPEPTQPVIKTQVKPTVSSSDIQIEGVGNLLTHMARCCKPVPGDDVIGYITLGKGVSIHRKDCSNILHANEMQKKRFVDVSWGSATKQHYTVDIVIHAYDRNGLLKDITLLLTSEKTNVYALNTQTDKKENIATIKLNVEIDSIDNLSKILAKLSQIPNVIDAKRV